MCGLKFEDVGWVGTVGWWAKVLDTEDPRVP
jgi:hypothetical protein